MDFDTCFKASDEPLQNDIPHLEGKENPTSHPVIVDGQRITIRKPLIPTNTIRNCKLTDYDIVEKAPPFGGALQI